MSLFVHSLKGCSPQPLAHYLKALGILRLVSEQADPQSRGFWADECFHLVTSLDSESLRDFFLNRYVPSAVLSPWNKGSGFVFAANNPRLSEIEKSLSDRLSPFRSAIAQARGPLEALVDADTNIRRIKDGAKVDADGRRLSKQESEAIRQSREFRSSLGAAEAEFKRLKNGQIPEFRRQWRGNHQRWMNSAMSIGADGVPAYPSLLGSGGNDGKNDFTKQFMESLALVMDIAGSESAPTAESGSWLDLAMFSTPAPNSDSSLPVGQFFPGMAGGPNMTTGFDGAAAVNPWDYILMIEGTMLFSSSITRRAAANSASLAAPFAVRASGVGYGSASRSEGAKRGEQWMPIWTQPSTLGDLMQLLASGRAQLGRAAASRPVDFARAVARLGVARGIAEFQRFGYLERNGQSNLAVPLGRWKVTAQPNQQLLDDLDKWGWCDSVRRAASDKNAPNSFSAAVQNLDESILAVCAHADDPGRWQVRAFALTDIEDQMILSGRFTAEKGLRPIPPLVGSWIRASMDGGPEARLAKAIAAQDWDTRGPDHIRHHWLPLEKSGKFAIDSGGLKKDCRVVCQGANLLADLIAVVHRRIVEGVDSNCPHFPLAAPINRCASLTDVAAFLTGPIDEQKTLKLARAFMAVDSRTIWPMTRDSENPMQPPGLAALYGLFRLTCAPWRVLRNVGGHLSPVTVRCDESVFARLSAGDIESAGELALRRLRASGFKPKLRHVTGTPELARRLAASLAIPISARAGVHLAADLTKAIDISQLY